MSFCSSTSIRRTKLVAFSVRRSSSPIRFLILSCTSLLRLSSVSSYRGGEAHVSVGDVGRRVRRTERRGGGVDGGGERTFTFLIASRRFRISSARDLFSA